MNNDIPRDNYIFNGARSKKRREAAIRLAKTSTKKAVKKLIRQAEGGIILGIPRSSLTGQLIAIEALGETGSKGALDYLLAINLSYSDSYETSVFRGDQESLESVTRYVFPHIGGSIARSLNGDNETNNTTYSHLEAVLDKAIGKLKTSNPKRDFDGIRVANNHRISMNYVRALATGVVSSALTLASLYCLNDMSTPPDSAYGLSAFMFIVGLGVGAGNSTPLIRGESCIRYPR